MRSFYDNQEQLFKEERISLVERRFNNSGPRIKEFEGYLSTKYKGEKCLLSFSIEQLESEMLMFERLKEPESYSKHLNRVMELIEPEIGAGDKFVYQVKTSGNSFTPDDNLYYDISVTDLRLQRIKAFYGNILSFDIKIDSVNGLFTKDDLDITNLLYYLKIELPQVILPSININHPSIITDDYLYSALADYRRFLECCMQNKYIRNSESLKEFLSNISSETLTQRYKELYTRLYEQPVFDYYFTKNKSDAIVGDPLSRIRTVDSEIVLKSDPRINNYLESMGVGLKEIPELFGKMEQITKDIAGHYKEISNLNTKMADLHDELISLIYRREFKDASLVQANNVYKNMLETYKNYYETKG